jgi:ABC-type Fe3+/spermidine/putrescine transport system ATPase subunit
VLELAAAEVRAEGIQHVFDNGHRALEPTDLHIDAGTFCTLLGPSGSGKTTLLRIFAGLLQPTAGRVHIGGRDVTTVPVQKRDIGFVFQHYALFPHLTVAQNIAYPLRIRGVSRTERDTKVAAVLDLIDLSDYGARRPDQLSGGQQQRVAIGRALVYGPKVLLLDEPLGALDRKLRQQLGADLRRIQQETGTTAIYVTHDQEEAMSVSDRIALMNAGRLEQVGVPVDIYRHPVSRFAAEFMGTTNLVAARVLGGGGDALVSLRPEALRFASDAPAEWPVLSGSVAHLELLGPLVRLDVRLADGTILKAAMLDAPDRQVQAGAAISLAYDPARLTVLP